LNTRGRISTSPTLGSGLQRLEQAKSFRVFAQRAQREGLRAAVPQPVGHDPASGIGQVPARVDRLSGAAKPVLDGSEHQSPLALEEGIGQTRDLVDAEQEGLDLRKPVAGEHQ
jgi:hypothetical protein